MTRKSLLALTSQFCELEGTLEILSLIRWSCYVLSKLKYGLHRLIYLNVWLLVGGTVFEGLEDEFTLEEVCPYECVWSFERSPHSQTLFLCLVSIAQM